MAAHLSLDPLVYMSFHGVAQWLMKIVFMCLGKESGASVVTTVPVSQVSNTNICLLVNVCVSVCVCVCVYVRACVRA